MRPQNHSHSKNPAESVKSSLNYYRDQLLRLIEFSKIEEEFFSKAESSEIHEIVDFLKTAKIANSKGFSEANLKKLLTRINQVTSGSTDIAKNSVEQVTTILDCLSSLNYEKYQLLDLELKIWLMFLIGKKS